MISSEVYSTIKSETRNEIRLHESEMIKAQPQIVGLRTILSEGHGGMLKVLSLKANQEDLDKFEKSKANQVQMNTMTDLFIEMSRLIQHIIVLQSETLKINLIKANDTIQARANKSHDLITQSHALSQWALKFDVQARLDETQKLKNEDKISV